MKAVTNSSATKAGRRSAIRPRCRVAGLWACMGLVLAGLAGCQTNVGGQTLPSAYYLQDDIQFFPAGSEFLLSNQAAAMQQHRLQQLGAPPQPQP